MRVTPDDEFLAPSARARALVRTRLEELWRLGRPAATLELHELEAPTGAMATVRGADGRLIAQVSAHADGANVLAGPDQALCALDGMDAATRAEWVLGALMALLAVERR